MVFDRSICHIPEGTVIEEKNLRCKGDFICADRSVMQRGIITEGRVFVGEFVEIEGAIISIGDVRVDKATRVAGDITGDSDIYIGKDCKVAGEIVVGKNLEIGEGADIDPKMIDSKGRISIRNPISVIVYILLYLLEMLKKSDSKEVDSFFKELEAGEEENILISKNFTYLPKGTRIGKEDIHIPGDLKIGPRTQLVANIQADGDIDLESEGHLFGDLEAKGNIFLGENVVINGSVTSEGDIDIHHAARIGGRIRGQNITVTPDTVIEGTLKGEEGIRIIPEGETELEEKLRRFESGVDSMEGVFQ